MMSSISRWCGYIAVAMLGCLSLIGFASASENLTRYHLRALAQDSGSYGAESAKLKAELAHMQSIQSDRTSGSTSLIGMSNHFVQAFLAKSGVAGGKIGVGAGALA